MVLLVSVLAASVAVSSAFACKTRTPGYWKTHPDNWCGVEPGDTITLTAGVYGFGLTYDLPGNALEILWMPVKGDARINLEQKVIAAMLSMNCDPDIGWDNDPRYGGATGLGGEEGLVAQAIELLNSDPGPWTPHSDAADSGLRADALALASQIDYWLNYFDIG